MPDLTLSIGTFTQAEIDTLVAATLLNDATLFHDEIHNRIDDDGEVEQFVHLEARFKANRDGVIAYWRWRTMRAMRNVIDAHELTQRGPTVRSVTAKAFDPDER